MNRSLLIGIGVVGLLVIAGVGWYLISPLFISQTVDEPLPFELPSQEEMVQMSQEDLQGMRDTLRETIPDEAELEQMPEADQAAVEEAAMSAAAQMPDMEMDDPMPTEPTVLVQGQFQGADDFHQGSGAATIYQLPDGNSLLRFEDFMVTNGPALRVFLSPNPAPTDHDSLGEYIDLGALSGNIGNQNYEIPPGTDVTQFQSVVIYCQPFSVLFATAPLS